MQTCDQALRHDDREPLDEELRGVTILCCDEGYRERLTSEISGIGGSVVSPPLWLGSAETCRTMVLGLGATLVIVGPGVHGVAPVNLVAALRQDDDERLRRLEGEGSLQGDALPIVLVEERVSGSSASRARRAGANDVVGIKGLVGVIEHHVLLGQVSSLRTGHARSYGTGTDAAAIPTRPSGGDRDATPLPEGERIRRHEMTDPPVLAASVATSGTDGPDHAGGERAWLDDEPLARGLRRGAHGLVCVTGARGGLGTTTIALLLSVLAGRAGIGTVLVDLDLRFGDLSYLLGLDGASTVFDAAGLRMLHGEVVEGVTMVREPGELAALIPGEVSFLAAPVLPEQGDAVVGRLDGLLASLEDGFDLVIVDCGSAWGDAQAAAIARCDVTCLVMGQRPSSVAACVRASSLALRLGVPQAHIAYVLNSCSQRGAVLPLDASMALGGAPIVELPDGGPMVGDLVGSGRPKELISQGNLLVPAVDGLLSDVFARLGIEVARSGPPRRGPLTWGRRRG